MRYEKYKAFEYDWLPEIPAHWDSKQLRAYLSLADERKGDRKDLQLLSVYREYGVIPKNSRTDNKNHESEDTSKYKVVKNSDIVVNKMKLWQGSLGVSKYDGFVSPAYIVAHNRFDGNLDYLNRILRSPVFKTYYNRISYGIRVGQWDSDYYDFKRLVIPVPPREEQDQIVRYLDWQVSKINKLIHGCQRQIKLLEERRQTVIDRAVTKGVRQGRQMHSIQANWMGDIPADWKMIPSKRLFLESKERKHPDDKPATASQKYGIILQEDYMKSENKRIVIATQGLDDWKHVEPDNFVISLRSFQGGIERSEIFGCVTWHYIVLLPQKYVVPRYFKWLLKSKSYIKALQGTSEFIRDGQDLRYSNFVKVDLPLIPTSEQEEIADYIEQETAKIDRAVPVLEKEIELLKEYCTRLISDVVTGQMDVRNVEVPEYTPEEDIAEEAPEEQEVEMDAD